MATILRAMLSEFVGTFALCFVGCGSVMLTHDSLGHGTLLTVALAHALILLVFVTACLPVSGAQFNPAVSVALWLTGRQKGSVTAAYAATQCAASAAAVGLLALLAGDLGGMMPALEGTRHGATLGSLALGTGGMRASWLAVLVLELLMTFALMFVILTTIVDRRSVRLGGLWVGGTVAACVLAFGPLTGASLNPARSFGPALFGHWQMHWVYWAGPIAGAVLAGAVHKVCWVRQPAGEPAAERITRSDGAGFRRGWRSRGRA